MAEPLILWSETFRFLELLGRAPDSVDALLFPPKEGPGSDKGAKKARLDEAGRQGVEMLLGTPIYRRHSLGIRPNPGGSLAKEITEGRALFFEADGGLPIEAQEALPELLGLPEPTVSVWSGNRSLHHYWVAEEGKELTVEEWRKAQKRLIAAVKEVAPEAGVDTAIKDPGRLMRAPGSIHPATGERCHIHSASGKRYDLADLVKKLPPLKEQRPKVSIHRGLPRPEAPASSLPRDQWEDLLIVRKMWAQSQLPFDRRMLKLISEDAPAMAEELGYGSPEELLRVGLQIDPEAIEKPLSPPRPLEEIEKAATFIPERVVGGNTYETCRHALCGCAAALAEIGLPEEKALDLLADKWPDRKTAQSVLESSTTRAAGSFWGIAKEHGYRPSASADTSSRYTSALSGLSALSGPHRKAMRELPTCERMDALRELAKQLINEGATPLDRMPIMRETASQLELPIRDAELQKLIWEARRKSAPPAEPLGTGDLLDFTPVPWCWEGMVMRGATTLVVALPKEGKTSLILAAIASWSQGQAFLGRQFYGKCPPVLIVGSDQPQSDWGRMLQRVGLVSEERRLLSPIVGLFHSGAPLSLDPEGIEKIASYASRHQGLLVVIDSYARCVASLGVSERDAEIAGPLADLQEALGPYGSTIVVIHHSNKGSRNDSASLASRGSTALPAACSQILHLQRVESKEGELQGALSGKRMLSTEGRGGAPEKLLLELDEEGKWIFKGDGDAVLHEEQHQRTIDSLNDRQAVALQHVEEVWAETEGRQGISAELLASRMELRGADTARVARRILEQLKDKGLVRMRIHNHGMGQALVHRYLPAIADSPDSADSADSKRASVSVIAEVGDYVELKKQAEPPCNGWRVVAASGVVTRVEHESTGEIRELAQSDLLFCCPF